MENLENISKFPKSFAFNYRLLHQLGLLKTANATIREKILWCISMVVISALLFLNTLSMIMSRTSDIFLERLVFFVSLVLLFIKTIHFKYNEKKIINIITTIQEVQRMRGIGIFTKIDEKCYNFQKNNLIMGVLFGLSLSILSFIMKKQNVFDMTLLTTNEDLLMLSSLIETVLSIYCAAIYVTMDNITYGLFLFLEAHLDCLIEEMRDLMKQPAGMPLNIKRLKEIIKYHNEILR